jgi:predicted metal-binding protein
MNGVAREQIRCLAVIQCSIARERCSGARCVMAFTNRDKFFRGYGPDTVLVPIPCGGCPGRRVSRLLANLSRTMKHHGITQEQIIVHLSSCICLDSSHYPVCPHVDYIRRILRRRGFRCADGSVESEVAARRREEGRYEDD